ncbi:MAG: 4Fe-4S binding protein [Clostridia bacterium]|nr:4Fe-4S binding protein [Clostridia bacterium]
MWIISTTYLVLGFFNILFAWLGLICFFVPIILSIVTGSKLFCKKYCGRGQLFTLIGDKLNICLNQETPKVLRSKIFRYGFLIFFLIMFVSMITNTYLVFENYKSVEQVVTLFWTFKLNWSFAYGGSVASWIAQFAFGFYSIMLTSTIIGFIMMILFKPRTWCVFCPMGTMCHLICEARNNADDDNTSDNNEDNSIAEKVVENEQEELTEDIRE